MENVEKVTLFDVYEGKQIDENKKSMAYRILLRSVDKTLEEDEINDKMTSIIEKLKVKFDIELRS